MIRRSPILAFLACFFTVGEALLFCSAAPRHEHPTAVVHRGQHADRTGGSLFLVGLVHAWSNAAGPGSGLTDGHLRVLYPADAEVVGVLHIVALALLGLVVMTVTRL
jgi:hypothetical protein